MKAASSEASHSTAAATSAVVPSRPSGDHGLPPFEALGVRLAGAPRHLGLGRDRADGVDAHPSAMWSRAAMRVNALTAAFDAV